MHVQTHLHTGTYVSIHTDIYVRTYPAFLLLCVATRKQESLNQNVYNSQRDLLHLPNIGIVFFFLSLLLLLPSLP